MYSLCVLRVIDCVKPTFIISISLCGCISGFDCLMFFIPSLLRLRALIEEMF